MEWLEDALDEYDRTGDFDAFAGHVQARIAETVAQERKAHMALLESVEKFFHPLIHRREPDQGAPERAAAAVDASREIRDRVKRLN